jgi:hypothetical protein
MKRALFSTLVVFQLLGCGRARDVEPGDGAGAGGTDGSEQTGGTNASGGTSSSQASGGSAAGGDVAVGGLGGEGALQLCEPLGYPAPTVTQRINLSHTLEEDSFDGFVRVSFSTDQSMNLLVNDEPLVSLDGLFGEPDDVLRSLFTEDEELHLSLEVIKDGSSMCVLRREDGEFVAFIQEGVFYPEIVASLDLPIPLSVNATCRNDETVTNVLEKLAVHTKVDAMDFELSTREEAQIQIHGRPFMLSVHYAGNVGACLSEESCLVLDRAEGLNVDMQVIALE